VLSQQPPMGWLRLTLQGNAMTTSLITPAVTVNGYRVIAHYGENVVPVWAGPNRVEVSCRWLLKFGQAALDVQVSPGAQVPVFYAAPWHQLSKGAIGFERQKRPGIVGLAVTLTVIILLVLAGVALPAALG
jgi:hypothetical protein